MGWINLEIPDEEHGALRNIKNNDDGRPGTVKDCVVEAISEYVDRYDGGGESDP